VQPARLSPRIAAIARAHARDYPRLVAGDDGQRQGTTAGLKQYVCRCAFAAVAVTCFIPLEALALTTPLFAKVLALTIAGANGGVW
jgi:hypothetical protein